MEMRIAQIAPLMESVPPKLYGGTERIVSCLPEELVRLVRLYRELLKGEREALLQSSFQSDAPGNVQQANQLSSSAVQ